MFLDHLPSILHGALMGIGSPWPSKHTKSEPTFLKCTKQYNSQIIKYGIRLYMVANQHAQKHILDKNLYTLHLHYVITSPILFL
jgi:hypothetical protein